MIFERRTPAPMGGKASRSARKSPGRDRSLALEPATSAFSFPGNAQEISPSVTFGASAMRRPGQGRLMPNGTNPDSSFRGAGTRVCAARGPRAGSAREPESSNRHRWLRDSVLSLWGAGEAREAAIHSPGTGVQFCTDRDDGWGQAAANQDAWRPPHRGLPGGQSGASIRRCMRQSRLETGGVDDRLRARGPAGKAREPFRASEMLAPKQVVEVNMSTQGKRSGGNNAAGQTYFQWNARRTSAPIRPGQEWDAATTAELKDALAREAALLREKEHLLRAQEILAQEFEHRLVNSLQMIVSLLTLQSRKAESAEAATQLTIAATRVGAFGRVHRRLHLLDHLETVELKHFIEQLCQDLSGMLCNGNAAHSLAVEGVNIEVPTNLGIPLGFIVNELITNAAKHAKGEITVRLETTPELGHCLAVSNDGPALPEGFHPNANKGLGLKIIQSLVRQINGRLEMGPGPGQHGACFKVFFPSTASSAIERAGANPREQRAPWVFGA